MVVTRTSQVVAAAGEPFSSYDCRYEDDLCKFGRIGLEIILPSPFSDMVELSLSAAVVCGRNDDVRAAVCRMSSPVLRIAGRCSSLVSKRRCCTRLSGRRHQ